MRRLPAAMSMRDVERRAAGVRRKLGGTAAGLAMAGSCCLPPAAWTYNFHWVAMACALWVMGAVPGFVYWVISTPVFVARLAEHYRARGVRFTEENLE